MNDGVTIRTRGKIKIAEAPEDVARYWERQRRGEVAGMMWVVTKTNGWRITYEDLEDPQDGQPELKMNPEERTTW